ncbi:MAG: hypothetical protein MUC49_13010 [Raineya sp.]|jgi:hypothetical protein|nr:hypothetical protein [Raineya sp.]
MNSTLKNNTKTGFSSIVNITTREISEIMQFKRREKARNCQVIGFIKMKSSSYTEKNQVKTNRKKREEPDFTMEDKEWIDKIDSKNITLEDIL